MSNLILYKGKSEIILSKLPSVNIVCTSPPYNISIKYNTYKDNMSYSEYIDWTDKWVRGVKKVLSIHGSFFLNVGFKPTSPYIAFDVMNVCRKYFILQNTFIWVKSISIDDDSWGHFKPINSNRFVNNLYEYVFHFTNTGNVNVDRLSLGVPYKDKTNVKRWSSGNDKRCRGDIWFIPYETVCSKKVHPAQFPVQLPTNCIKLVGYNSRTTVLDPFIGVGNTAIACKKLGVNCIGVDLDSVYLDITYNNFYAAIAQ